MKPRMKSATEYKAQHAEKLELFKRAYPLHWVIYILSKEYDYFEDLGAEPNPEWLDLWKRVEQAREIFAEIEDN